MHGVSCEAGGLTETETETATALLDARARAGSDQKT